MAKVEIEDVELDALKKSVADMTAKLNAKPNEDKEDKEEIGERIEKVNKSLKKATIEGASESTMHAVLEEVRALRSEMSDGGFFDYIKEKRAKPSSSSPVAPTSEDSGLFKLFDF